MEHGFIIKWYHVFTNAFYFIRLRIYSLIKKEASGCTGNLLDFGCGSMPYKELFHNVSTYTGLDIEVSGHSNDDKKADVYYDGVTIPFADSHFDTVFSSEVFEHVFSLEAIIPEINRVLKPGGKLLITCPFVWPEHETPYDYARYSSFGIRHLLEKNGFQVLQQYKTGHFTEVVIQQMIFYIFCMLPKKPAVIYSVLHQVFILPLILVNLVLNALLIKRMKRTDLYHNNVLLLIKVK